MRRRSKTRAEAMTQAEETLKHYQRLAQETVEKARQERQRLQVLARVEAGERSAVACTFPSRAVKGLLSTS